MKLKEFISQLQAYEKQWNGEKEVIIECIVNCRAEQLRIKNQRFILVPGTSGSSKKGSVAIKCLDQTDITEDCEGILEGENA